MRIKRCFALDIIGKCNNDYVCSMGIEDGYEPNYIHNYNYAIEKGSENVYISVKAFDPHTKNNIDVATISIKNGSGKIDGIVTGYIQELDNAIEEYWKTYWNNK